MYKFLLFCLFALSGCASTHNIVPGSEITLNPNEGIVIIGVSKDEKLFISSGSVTDNKFVTDSIPDASIVGTSELGYLIRKLKVLGQGKVYGIIRISKNGKDFASKCNSQIFTFTASPKVAKYIGEITVNEVDAKSIGVKRSWNSKGKVIELELRIKSDFESAKMHFASQHPKSKIKVIKGKIQNYLKESNC